MAESATHRLARATLGLIYRSGSKDAACGAAAFEGVPTLAVEARNHPSRRHRRDRAPAQNRGKASAALGRDRAPAQKRGKPSAALAGQRLGAMVEADAHNRLAALLREFAALTARKHALCHRQAVADAPIVSLTRAKSVVERVTLAARGGLSWASGFAVGFGSPRGFTSTCRRPARPFPSAGAAQRSTCRSTAREPRSACPAAACPTAPARDPGARPTMGPLARPGPRPGMSSWALRHHRRPGRSHHRRPRTMTSRVNFSCSTASQPALKSPGLDPHSAPNSPASSRHIRVNPHPSG